MRYVSEKVLDEKIVELRQMVGVGHGMFDTQLLISIICIETLKECCLEEAMLRPMGDAPTGVPILVSTGKELREAFVSKDGVVNFSDCNLFDALALGWRPI